MSLAYTAEEKALLWLSAAEVSVGHQRKLMERFGSAEGVWAVENAQLSSDAKTASKLQELHSREAVERIMERLDKHNIRVLFRHSPDYPELLGYIQDAPNVLYCAGNLAALRHPCVSIVGTRHPSEYGRDMARLIARGLSEQEITVVSGLAKGIDGSAHEGALAGGGRTVAVLGCGLNVVYPAENRSLYRAIVEQGGLLLTEYPLDAEPLTFHFPARNRIIAGLSRALVFVEGRIRSGGMLTVGLALDGGREVFAVPGRVGFSVTEGPHAIIREGARLVTCAEDILEDMGQALSPPVKLPAKPQWSVEQAAILRQLQRDALLLGQLRELTQLSAETLQNELSMLEIDGVVRREAGSRYAICPERIHMLELEEKEDADE